MEPTVELMQFRYSHYNEKARWALEWKGVPHRRRSLLPGPHAPTILWLTRRTEVPVARFDGEIVAGSAQIIDELERRHPEPPLYPADPAARARALELQRHFDTEVGPAVRCGFFGHLLGEPDYVCGLFADDRSWLTQKGYRALFPITKALMSRSMGIAGRESIERACKTTRQALDLVVESAGPTGHLVGEAFSVADLTAASLLAPAVGPDHPDMAYPDPRPDALVRWLERFRDHPGAAWVRETYHRHRPRARAAEAA